MDKLGSHCLIYAADRCDDVCAALAQTALSKPRAPSWISLQPPLFDRRGSGCRNQGQGLALEPHARAKAEAKKDTDTKTMTENYEVFFST